MAALSIPKSHHAGLARIIAMENAAADELFTALDKATPTLMARDFAEQLAKTVTRLPSSEIRQLLGVVLGMYQARGASDMSPLDFAEEICKVIEESKSDVLKIPAERREDVRQRLAKLLGYENSLGVTSKALDVMTEHERILCGARIVTDIRPVFGRPTDKPTAAVIVHNLKISYHQDDEHREFYVALDTEDVVRLRTLLERAEMKAQSLEALLQRAATPYLKVS